MAKITIELDDALLADYADSVGAYSDDPAVVLELVTEAIERHIGGGIARVRNNRKVEEAYALAESAIDVTELIKQGRKPAETAILSSAGQVHVSLPEEPRGAK